jgi:hypothetical protein
LTIFKSMPTMIENADDGIGLILLAITDITPPEK